MKKCPYCAEEIQDEAIKCRHCGEFLDRPSETEGEPAKEEVQTDPWQEFSEKYQAAVDPQKRRFWKGLDQGQKEYVASRFGITEPPPPKKRKFGLLTYGCLTSIVLAIILFAVILPPRMKDAEEPSKTTPSQSGPRVWTPEELTGKKIPDSTTPRKHFVYAKSVVNIRKGPGKNHSVVGKTHPGEKLEYMSRSGDWFKLVPDGEKKERYIHNSIVLSQLEKDTRDRAQIALLNWSWQENYGYAVAEGKVKNVSSGTLENVQVVVSYETAGGDFITSDSTLIEYTTLLPGQTSPFKSMARWNPAMKKASLSFKTLFGNKLIAYKE